MTHPAATSPAGTAPLAPAATFAIIAVELHAAKAFIRVYHRHSRPIVGWLFGAGLLQDGWAVGVVTVGRPVARGYDDGRTVEVTRVCLKPDVPNGCSRLYAWARRETHRRRYARILTYTRADEPGTSLRAAGWVEHHRVKGRGWSCPTRPRRASEVIDKVMWIPGADVGLWPTLQGCSA